MRILFLSQIVPYPPHGGVLQRGYNVVRELHKKNKLYLLAFVHPDVLNTEELIKESRNELSNFCEIIEYFPLWPKKSNFHKYMGFLLGSLSRQPFSVIAHKSQSYKKRISEIINSEDIDLIHFDTIALAQYNNENINVPKVVTHQNIESMLMRRRADVERNLVAKYYLTMQTEKIRKYEISECPKFDRNIVVSDVDAKELGHLIPGINTAVIPNGVDTEYLKPGYDTDNDAPSLIYIGGMNMFANSDAVMFFLKEVWPLIKIKVPKVKFFAVGQDPPNELMAMNRKDANIEVAGYVDDIRPYISRASVYVVPLRVGGGTRLKVLDAMAAGKAIVSTSIGCEGIKVEPEENILIADTPLIFAEKTCLLLADSQKRVNLGKAARKLVENKYSWEIIGGKLQETYELVISDRNS